MQYKKNADFQPHKHPHKFFSNFVKLYVNMYKHMVTNPLILQWFCKLYRIVDKSKHGLLAAPEGLEPTTLRLGNECSVLMS